MDIIKRNSDDKRLKDKINDPTEVSKEESYNIKSGNMIAIPQSTSILNTIHICSFSIYLKHVYIYLGAYY